MKKYNFFKEETFDLRHQLTFVGDKLEIYLPKNYFGSHSKKSWIGPFLLLLWL